MHRPHAILALMLLTSVCIADDAADPKTDSEDQAVPPALKFTMNDIDGNPVDLANYHGRVVLMVNVASKCGLTKQYKELQALHEKYAEQGLAVLGFPANNFGNQEPGSEEEIKAFCQKNFGVTFPMFSKVSVKGEDTCDLYKHLTTQETSPVGAGAISWNFEKFLIARDGSIAARFAPKTKPDADEVITAIETELSKPAP